MKYARLIYAVHTRFSLQGNRFRTLMTSAEGCYNQEYLSFLSEMKKSTGFPPSCSTNQAMQTCQFIPTLLILSNMVDHQFLRTVLAKVTLYEKIHLNHHDHERRQTKSSGQKTCFPLPFDNFRLAAKIFEEISYNHMFF